MRIFIVLALLPVVLFAAACTTERVETEFAALNTALKSADAKVTPLLAPGLEEARQAEITASAQAGDPWFLSDGCRQVLDLDPDAPLASCEVETVSIGDRAPAENNATAAKRKLDTLRAYVSALELLMDSSLETEVTSAYSAALAAFGALGDATKTVELVDFIKDRQDNKAKADAVVSEAIATLRYRKMREVVLASDEDVRTVARELQLNLINLNVDEGFKDETDALRKANIAVLTADTRNTAAYRAAIVDLQTKHENFMTFYEKTAVYQVGLIGQVHGTLASALSSSGSVEDVISYLESLKQLIETVEG